VYAGQTADELADAIMLALREADDSLKKAKRIAVAREHSIENISGTLWKIIEESLH
jgi:hypothetical protein